MGIDDAIEAEAQAQAQAQAQALAIYIQTKDYERAYKAFMKRQICCITSLAIIWVLPHSAAAADALAAQFPERSVRLLVGFGAGGGTDIAARLISKSLFETWGRSVVVENKPGADGSIAAAEISKSKPDGYNLLFTTTAITITPVQQTQPFDPVTSFEPITLIGSSPSMVVVHPSLPVNSIKQLIALAKAKPGALSFGSSGTGTVPYLATELFRQSTGTDMVHVPYKGGGPAVLGILSGEVQLLFNGIGPVFPYVKTGRLKALAVTSPKRQSVAPEIPTMIESGLPGFDTATWYAVFVPAKTPREIVRKLNADFVKATRLPEIRTNLEQQGFVVEGSSAAELAQLVQSDLARWSRVVKNIK
jgi:tripartite-type tricarboxylate transporter receptor subunit TctC